MVVSWRRFQFFDRAVVEEPTAENGATNLSKVNVTCAASGTGTVYLGDEEGGIHVVNRNFESRRFVAHSLGVYALKHLRQRPFLITIGEDEAESGPVYKVWNTETLNAEQCPTLLRTARLFTSKQAVQSRVTCMSTSQDFSQLAVGFENGTIVLVRGDLLRDRHCRTKVLPADGDRAITNIFFREDIKTYLYATTSTQTFSYRLTDKAETKIVLDAEQGCEKNCACLSERGELIVGTDEAVFFYGPDEKGSAFAFDGHKLILAWFRGYLIVVSAEGSRHTLIVYDLTNRFIALQSTFEDIKQVVCEFGRVLVITAKAQTTVYQLIEKDTTTKIDMLFKKHLYSIAIDLAHKQQFDDVYIADIFKMYGDHLYDKGDFDTAMQQYLQTLGHVEPSYVIQKFLDAQRIHNLTTYLQTLHSKNVANKEHTTLLLNCYVKLKDTEKLEEFLKNDSREMTFDVETAIAVCRQAGYRELALFLAEKHHQHQWYLKIQIEDLKEYKEAILYIKTLPFQLAEKYVMEYGKALMNELPEESTALVMALCTSYVPIVKVGPPVSKSSIASIQPSVHSGSIASLKEASFSLSGSMDLLKSSKSKPEDFIHIFVDQSNSLKYFLEFIVREDPNSSTLIYNTLLELLLQQRQSDKNRVSDEDVMNLLKNPLAKYDADHGLMLCQMFNFTRGVLYLYEKMALFQDVLLHYMEMGDHAGVLQSCIKYEARDPNLWLQALTYFVKKQNADCEREILEVLKRIDQQNLLSPLLVLQILSGNPKITLKVVKDYISRRLQTESTKIASDLREIRRDREETERMRNEIHELKTSARVFQSMKCSACLLSLDLPAIHFLCMHSFHQRCLLETERECPKCSPEAKRVMERKANFDAQTNHHEQFFKELEGAKDGFSTVAEYFGRGIFNKPPLAAQAAGRPVMDEKKQREALFGGNR